MPLQISTTFSHVILFTTDFFAGFSILYENMNKKSALSGNNLIGKFSLMIVY